MPLRRRAIKYACEQGEFANFASNGERQSVFGSYFGFDRSRGSRVMAITYFLSAMSENAAVELWRESAPRCRPQLESPPTSFPEKYLWLECQKDRRRKSVHSPRCGRGLKVEEILSIHRWAEKTSAIANET